MDERNLLFCRLKKIHISDGKLIYFICIHIALQSFYSNGIILKKIVKSYKICINLLVKEYILEYDNNVKIKCQIKSLKPLNDRDVGG